MCVSFPSILVTVVVPPIKARLLASFAAYFFVPLNQPGSQDAANTGPFSFFFFFQCPTFSCGVCLHFFSRGKGPAVPSLVDNHIEFCCRQLPKLFSFLPLSTSYESQKIISFAEIQTRELAARRLRGTPTIL